MKEVKVVSYKEVGFDYNVCDEIYENGCGRMLKVDCQMLSFGRLYLKIGWSGRRMSCLGRMLVGWLRI